MKKSRMKLFLALALGMLLLCMTGTAFAVPPLAYDLWVGGVRVTDENKSNITGDGTAAYDPDTNTLTLNGFSYTGDGHTWENGDGYGAAIYYGGDTPLKLELKGASSVTSPDEKDGVVFYIGIYSIDGITVGGDGSLTATGGSLTATGDKRYVSYGVYAEGSIEVNSGSLTGKGGTAYSSCGVLAIGSITVNGGSLTGKGGAAYIDSYGVSGGGITVAGGSLTGESSTVTYQYGGSFGVDTYNGSDITVNGGTVEAQGEMQAFYKEPAIGDGFTTAKVWYGTLGPEDPDDIPDNYYTEKYVRIAPYCSVGVTTDGSGTVKADPESGEPGTKVTLTATPNAGYQFKEWQVVSGGVSIKDNAFTIGSKNVEIRAIFEPIPVQGNLPQTGDSSAPLFWLAMGTLSVLGIVLLRKKAYSK